MYIFKKDMTTVFQSFRHSMKTRKSYRRRKYTLAKLFKFFFLIYKLIKLNTFSQDYKQRLVIYKSLYFVKITLI
jgi:hypothetical protein